MSAAFLFWAVVATLLWVIESRGKDEVIANLRDDLARERERADRAVWMRARRADVRVVEGGRS